MKKALTLFLLIDAAVITAGLLQGRNMWSWICLYWAVNTVKNATEVRK